MLARRDLKTRSVRNFYRIGQKLCACVCSFSPAVYREEAGEKPDKPLSQNVQGGRKIRQAVDSNKKERKGWARRSRFFRSREESLHVTCSTTTQHFHFRSSNPWRRRLTEKAF